MGWFRRNEKARDEHPEPVVLDLGLRKEFEVDFQVQRLQAMGRTLHLLAQSENPRLGDLFPKHCRVFVAPDDAAEVRRELQAVGLL